MANKRYDCCTPRPWKDKVYWHKIGSAFESSPGSKTHMKIILDSLPLPNADGAVEIVLFEAKSSAPMTKADMEKAIGDEIF